MARKTTTIGPLSAAFGRDEGKTYLITEMPATQGERWATRALNAMAQSGIEIPPEFMGGGWAIVAMVGFKAVLSADYAQTGPLMDEMMGCIKSMQPAAPEGRALIEEDIEEIATRAYLKDEVFRVHAGFSIRESLLNAMTTATPETDENTLGTPTSREPLESWSLGGSPATQTSEPASE